ncbi:LOW QUALITY PROTEIN: cuticle protein 7 [Drosophila serrata]|uniref:LOW QUALITY PROTEIN: cuticle protein 7 n=1 Tax=Drosophila serrata TaxID=7274 RepID=UPI000A1D1869|nr:LOW QUALITY PROTEIN: cuticle protein 7 [Drosophila serrata]
MAPRQRQSTPAPRLQRLRIRSVAQPGILSFTTYGSNHDEKRLRYSHQYQISDPASQVHILHREQRHGDYVSGSYSHLEPDGHIRSVHYEVRGPGRGFKAVVEHRTRNSRVHQELEFRGRQSPPLRALALAEPVAFVI